MTGKEIHEELQEKVIDHWIEEGVEFQVTELVSDDPVHYDSFVIEKYQTILDSATLCAQELGFESLADYLAKRGGQDD